LTPGTHKFPRALTVTVAATAVSYAAVAAMARHSFPLTVFGDSAQLLLAILVIIAFGYQAWRGQGRIRFFWAMMAAGAACWLFSQAIWSYYEVVLRVDFNDSSIQDLILFLHLVPMMAALATMPHEPRKMPSVVPYSLAMLAVWWLFLYAYIVTPWQYIYPNLDIYNPSFNFLYSTEDLAFIVALGLLAVRSTGAWRTFYSRLCLGSIGYAISSQITNIAIDDRRYYTGSYYDIPLVLSIACICWAASGANTAASVEEAEDPARESLAARWITRLSFFTLLSVPLMAAWSLGYSHAPAAVRHFRVSISLIVMVALSALLFALQWLLSDRLHASLQTASESLGELATAREALQHQATHDSMTGCLNRSAITEALARELLRASRAGLPLAVFLIDLDHFKQINDRLGHHAGDIAIVAACTRMQDCVRAHDYFGRYGGEEFLAVIPDADETTALQIAERMRGRISMNAVVFNSHPIHLTATIGVALSEPGDTPEALLRRADLALYSGKRMGRDTVQLAKQEVNAG
jgi:diguanylate cyclase (GGDEF)-like protein